ncbi:MAG TPA: tRNA pseudouridine synthase A [Sphingobacterium bovisgrunnientis]|nr:tRNA pseudouridine synthase A [Sphingobacterium bovisgrunnientis]
MRFFFHIAYHGQQYGGWQRQPNVLSIQELIEDALHKILKTPTTIYGCGRTDSQVNASQYFFHADIVDSFEYDLVYRLNKALPSAISIYEILPMEGKPHARFDATHRQYDYFLHTYKDPFLNMQSALYLYPNMDLVKMNAAVNLLPKYQDYRAFCVQPDKNEHTLCHVSEANLYVNTAGDRIRFNILSNRFLGKMIRILAGKLIQIGRGTMSVSEFENHLITKDIPKILTPAYPVGLYLSKVTYPYLDIAPRTSLMSPDQNTEWIKL